MAFQIVVLCAALAYANAGYIGAPAVHYSPAETVSSSYIHQAGAPVAAYAQAAPVATYAHAGPVAVHAPHVGATSQSVVRSLGGDQAVSHYSKAVDSAFSSVRKYDTRITNDAAYAHVAPVAAYAAPVAHATYAHAAPVAHTYAAAPVATYAQAAPVASYSHAAPVAHYAQQLAPVASYAHAAPVAHYAQAAPVASYAHAAPVAHYAHAAPVAHYAHAAPVAHYAQAAPVGAYAAHAGPIVAKSAIAYSPASVVSHASFSGLGAQYQW